MNNSSKRTKKRVAELEIALQTTKHQLKEKDKELEKRIAVLEAEMKRNEDSFKKEMGEIRAPNSQLKELLEATKKKGPTTDPNLWTVAEVIDWLKQKPLRSFAAIAQKFEEENIIGEVFLELKQEDLNGLGIAH